MKLVQPYKDDELMQCLWLVALKKHTERSEQRLVI